MSEAVRLTTPLGEDDVRGLRAGQEVLLSGTVVTARDMAHRYLTERADDDGMPFDLSGAALYHCGPVMQEAADGWHVISAGPTTSARMELYQQKVIERYKVRAVIGKGGMGPATAAALKSDGAVYLAAASGAGAVLAKCIISVRGVWKLDEFGPPEALWALEVTDLPAVVAMDCEGTDIYKAVRETSAANLKRLAGMDACQN